MAATPATGKPLAELHRLWDQLGDVPTSEGTDVLEDGAIEEPFLHFGVGTLREDIWHWFENMNPEFVVGDVMSGLRKH